MCVSHLMPGGCCWSMWHASERRSESCRSTWVLNALFNKLLWVRH